VWVYYGGRGDTATDTVRLGFDCSGDAVADFVGRMDDVAIFNVTLTEQEVAKWMYLSLPVTASAPYPGNGVIDVPRRDVVLTWKPGVYANTHDVYFGLNPADVSTATRTDPRGVLVSQGQSETHHPLSGGLDLDFGTTCYWRVDEVNAPPDATIMKGELWSFTTEPIAYPIDGRKIVTSASSSAAGQGPANTVNSSGRTDDLHSDVLAAMWLTAPGAAGPVWIQYEFDTVYKLAETSVWNHNGRFERSIGLGCRNVTIEYSLNGIDFTALGTTHEFAQASGKPGYAHSNEINLGGITAKYVKLTVNSNWKGIIKQYGLSEVRFFSIPVLAREPNPIPGAIGIDPSHVLARSKGKNSHCCRQV